MRIAVCVKHAVDETELRIDSSGAPQLDGAVAKMSAFDKNSIEEALRLRSAHSGEVVAYLAGPPDAKKTMREALDMGVDRGVIISVDQTKADALRVAKLLAAAITKGGPYDLVICAEGSSDIYTGQVPPMLGELLAIPYVGYVKKIELEGGLARVERSLEEGDEEVEAKVPMVLSVVSEINEPRYPTLIQIVQAAKKPVDEIGEEDLGVAKSTNSPWVVSMSAQSSNRKGILIEGSPDEAATRLVGALERDGVLPK
jgi:electron transfer flavoprotein beta subunit